MSSFTQGIQAQLVSEDLVCAEKARLGRWLSFRSAPDVYHGYNILYHNCHWRVNPSKNGYLRGKVTSLVRIDANADSIGFDFKAQMQVDSILWHGSSILFTRNGDVVYCHKPGGWVAGETDSLTFYYQGNPQSGSGFGYYVWDQHQTGPVIHTLSQPYGASYWWPCKQTLTDKIDSMDIHISVPPGFKAGSNGILTGRDSLNDTTIVYHWKHRYPVATYLVAFAASNYVEFTETARFYNRPDTLPVLNYVFPQSLTDAKKDVSSIIPIMRLFDSLFGEYPFMREKYGHTQFTWGGGMEHQTMSFMVNFSFDLQAHELAHQWFGDMVTCGSWADLWLNEGFATYANALCYQYLQPSEWINRLAGLRNAATSQDDGSVYAKDTLTINRLFSGTLTYNKGAFILHMLRIKVGDQAFFGALRKYLKQNRLAYGFALTQDLQSIMEQESAMNLDTFFLRWYKGEGFPYLKINWEQSGNQVKLRVIQTPSHPSVPFFELAIPIRFRNSSRDTIITFYPGQTDQSYVFSLPFPADSAEFDPFVTVLAKASLGGLNLDKVNTGPPVLAPNPVREMLTIKPRYRLIDRIEITDITGRTVWESPSGFAHSPGQDIQIPVSDFCNGTYVARIYSQNSVTSLKFNKI